MNMKKKAILRCSECETESLFEIFDAVDDLHKLFSGGINKENDLAVQNECLSRLKGLNSDTVRSFVEFVSLLRSGYSIEIRCCSDGDRRFIEDD